MPIDCRDYFLCPFKARRLKRLHELELFQSAVGQNALLDVGVQRGAAGRRVGAGVVGVEAGVAAAGGVPPARNPGRGGLVYRPRLRHSAG